jgi:arsenite methyltransferase
VYKGTLPSYPHGYDLDDHHHLTTGKPMLVCGNTASMLSETWLEPHFAVSGDRSVHFGVFPCGPEASSAASPGEACC